MWAGLLTFTALIVWGVTGIHAVFLPEPGGYTPPEVHEVTETPFSEGGDLGDAELARKIYEGLDIPVKGGHYNIHRDDEQNLAFFIFSANGRRDVTYLEEEGVVRIEFRKNEIASFLSTMHTAHSRRGPKNVAGRAWGLYNELATWAFFFMTVSGVYLWAATRPFMVWARWTLGVSVVSALVLWFAVR